MARHVPTLNPSPPLCRAASTTQSCPQTRVQPPTQPGNPGLRADRPGQLSRPRSPSCLPLQPGRALPQGLCAVQSLLSSLALSHPRKPLPSERNTDVLGGPSRGSPCSRGLRRGGQRWRRPCASAQPRAGRPPTKAGAGRRVGVSWLSAPRGGPARGGAGQVEPRGASRLPEALEAQRPSVPTPLAVLPHSCPNFLFCRPGGGPWCAPPLSHFPGPFYVVTGSHWAAQPGLNLPSSWAPE